MRDPAGERRRFAGTRRCQDTEILGRWLANNAGLFIIERHGAFGESEMVTHYRYIHTDVLDWRPKVD